MAKVKKNATIYCILLIVGVQYMCYLGGVIENCAFHLASDHLPACRFWRPAVTIIMVLLFSKSICLFSTLLDSALLLVVIHIIKEDTNPTFKIPWIVLNLTLIFSVSLISSTETFLPFSRKMVC